MPDGVLADGGVWSSTFYETYIRPQLVNQCTRGNRPTGTEGKLIAEVDTKKLQLHTGTDWSWMGGWGLWDTYKPTLTNFTWGSADVEARWLREGRRITFFCTVTLAAGSAVTGLIGVSLPVTAARVDQKTVGAWVYNNSAIVPMAAVWGSTSRIDLYANNTSTGTYVVRSATSSTVPINPWASGMIFAAGGVYEAAAA